MASYLGWRDSSVVHSPCSRCSLLNGHCFSQELPMFITAMDWRGAEMSHENNSTGQPHFFPLEFSNMSKARTDKIIKALHKDLFLSYFL